MADEYLKRGVTEDNAGGTPDVDDFDMNTTLVPAQVIFDHQKRWRGRISSEDLRELRTQPLTSIREAFETFTPEADFKIEATERDALLEKMRAAHVHAADDPKALGEWGIKGRLTELADFSPTGVAVGGEKWSKNILESLNKVDVLLANATSAAPDIDFDSRDELIEDIDAVLDLLSASATKGGEGA